MAILIKGIDLPKSCARCVFLGSDHESCVILWKYVTHNVRYETINHGCPLISVPAPHGRLIDADIAKVEVRRAEALARAFGYHNAVDAINNAPTIIESEE